MVPPLCVPLRLDCVHILLDFGLLLFDSLLPFLSHGGYGSGEDPAQWCCLTIFDLPFFVMFVSCLASYFKAGAPAAPLDCVRCFYQLMS